MRGILLGIVLLSLICFVNGCNGVKQKQGDSASTPMAKSTETPTPIVMVMVPATGKDGFQMGQTGIAAPVHAVKLSSFYIGAFEVTNTEYCAFLNASDLASFNNPSEGGSTWWYNSGAVTYDGIVYDEGGNVGSRYTVRSDFGNRPVVCVSWYGAVAYCNWKSEQDGLQKCYGDYQADGLARWGNNGANYHPERSGYRLPTEAEWEYACRATTTTTYYWGDTMDGSYCWYNENSRYYNHDVGTAGTTGHPNLWGLYDMSGNVWEWCSDWYGDYDAGTDIDPIGPPDGYPNRVIRGGGARDGASDCGSAFRRYHLPVDGINYIGFRLARAN